MLTVQIETGNAAFDDGHAECARILRELADRIEAGEDNGLLQDRHGNKVGEWDLDIEDRE